MSDQKIPPNWAKAAQKELRDRSLSELTWATPEGFDVKPLYTAADLEGFEAANADKIFESTYSSQTQKGS